MWTWIKTQLSDMWAETLDWIAAHKWYIVAALLVLIAATGAWCRDYSLRRELSSLASDYAQNLDKLKGLEAETTRLKNELDAKADALAALQSQNDVTIKEAAENAYHTAISLPDDTLLDAFNELISGARSRNAERGRTDTSN